MENIKRVIDKLAATDRSRLITEAAFMKPFSIRQDGAVPSY
jgi:hypothetical protein